MTSTSEVGVVVVCASCKGVGHKRKTNKTCPNSRWGKMRIKKFENTYRLKEALRKFEWFIADQKIETDQLAPAFCSDWMDIEHSGGNSYEWKLDPDVKKILFDLHLDVASLVYGHEFEESEIIDCVSPTTKTIYGIVGSNAGRVWYGYDVQYNLVYRQAHYGTIVLLNLWNVTIESENVKCNV